MLYRAAYVAEGRKPHDEDTQHCFLEVRVTKCGIRSGPIERCLLQKRPIVTEERFIVWHAPALYHTVPPRAPRANCLLLFELIWTILWDEA